MGAQSAAAPVTLVVLGRGHPRSRKVRIEHLRKKGCGGTCGRFGAAVVQVRGLMSTRGPWGKPKVGSPISGQILQPTQTNVGQMAQESNKSFEPLEAPMREQAVTHRALAEFQVKASEAMTKKSNVVDRKGLGNPETLKGSHEEV